MMSDSEQTDQRVQHDVHFEQPLDGGVLDERVRACVSLDIGQVLDGDLVHRTRLHSRARRE